MAAGREQAEGGGSCVPLPSPSSPERRAQLGLLLKSPHPVKNLYTLAKPGAEDAWAQGRVGRARSTYAMDPRGSRQSPELPIWQQRVICTK